MTRRDIIYCVFIFIAAFGIAVATEPYSRKLRAKEALDLQAKQFELVFGQPPTQRFVAAEAVDSYFEAMMGPACEAAKKSSAVPYSLTHIAWETYRNRLTQAARLANEFKITVPGEYAKFKVIENSPEWPLNIVELIPKYCQ